MALPNRMSLRPALIWLTLNLALIIQCLARKNIYIYIYIYIVCSFNFTYPLRCLRVPPGVRVPQVEYHCSSVEIAKVCVMSEYNSALM
jgi:hypothetical protein